MNISGRRVLLTGATGGIGHAAARRLHAAGASLVLTARRKEVLAELAAELDRSEVVTADLSIRSDVDELAGIARTCDVVVLNAALGGTGSVTDLHADQIDQVIDVNLRAPIQLTTDFVQHKLATGAAAHVVLIGSLAGIAASPGSEMYNATKFGLRGFALSLAQDLYGTCVGASLIAPGFIRDAGMFHDSGVELPPVVRMRTPDDVAEGIVKAIATGAIELTVAPAELRLATTLGGIAPGLSARIQRAIGAGDRFDQARAAQN